MSTLSLAWAVANKGTASTIAGSRNLEQLEANFKGVTYPLSPEVYAKLNEITQPILDKLGDNPDYWENRNESRIS
jgi:myo-inositol catabolism protein IolS